MNHKLHMDDTGAVAVITALVATLIVIVAGMAVDYHLLNTTQTRLQNSLDAAVLAAVSQPVGKDKEIANAMFGSKMSKIKIENRSDEWVRNSDGTFTGTIRGQFPTMMMRIFRQNTVEMIAKATAARTGQAPATVVINVISAKGWFWKQMTLWVHKPGDATDSLLATYTYQPTDLFNGGTGTTMGPFGQPISLGTNYDYAYFRLDVSTDGCPPGTRPQYPQAINASDWNYWANYVCVSNPGLAKGKSYTLSTNDPATADHLFVDGKQLPANQPAPISNLLFCGKSATHGWEDTEKYNANDQDNVNAWQTQDIIFTVDTTACGANGNINGMSRLIN